MISAVAAAFALAGPSMAASAHPDFTGMWVLTTGETPPIREADISLTPSAQAQVAARRNEIADGFAVSEGHLRCLPAGMPQMMTVPFGMQVMQSRDRVLIAPEISNLPRTIFLNAKHPDPADLDPSWNGHSVGHWQGRTLVVDTIGFNDREALDFNFTPPVLRTPSLHITERIRLAQGGRLLVDEMTLVDPTTFTKPAVVTYTYRKLPPEEGLMEYVCEVDLDAIKAFEAHKPPSAPASGPRAP
jgi:hypothetical protein